MAKARRQCLLGLRHKWRSYRKNFAYKDIRELIIINSAFQGGARSREMNRALALNRGGPTLRIQQGSDGEKYKGVE